MIGGVVESVRDALAHEPSVGAIFLCGSHVTGLAAAQSDVDFTVLVADNAGVGAAMQRLVQAFEFLGQRHEVPMYRAGHARLAVCVYPQPWTDDWVAKAYRSPEDLKQWQGWLRHKVVEAKAVVDPAGVLQSYREQLDGYPDELADGVAREALGRLRREFLEDWNFRNPFHLAYCLREMLEHVGLALFALNRRLYAPPLKHWQRDIPELRPDLTTELEKLVRLSPETDLETRQDVLEDILRKLEGAIGPVTS